MSYRTELKFSSRRCIQAFLIAAISMVPATTFAGTVVVRQTDFGGRWPFTVLEGTIACTSVKVDSLTVHILTFKVGDKVYALNGAAKSRARMHGYLEIDAIWKDDPNKPGAKIDISPIMKKGLEICDN